MIVSPNNSGHVTVDGVAYSKPIAYSSANTVRLEAIPADGYVFSNWSDALTGNINPVDIVMSCTKTVTANFIAGVTSCTLGNFVWEDKDADGIQDDGEPGINGVTVELYNTGDELLSTTITSGGGYYTFSDLAAGNYYLKFLYIISGFVFSPMNQGDSDLLDSDVDHQGKTGVFTLSPGQNNVTQDAGLYRPGSMKFTFEFGPGLQIISLPLVPNETQPESIFSGIDFTMIGMYLKSQSSFKIYLPGYQPDQNFVWTDGVGYWLEMNSYGTLTVEGCEIHGDLSQPNSYPVTPGWNLVGFKSTIPRTPSDYLASIQGKYDMIYGYGQSGFFIVGLGNENEMKPGCGYWIHVTAPGTIVPPLEQDIEDISVQQAYDMITAVPANPHLVILDVRTPAEYNGGHISGAANLDYYSSTFAEDLNNLDKTNVYIVYCKGGGRSATVINMMENLGFREAYNMVGGITAWIGAGFPVVN